ncbi:MAG: sugar phosphate nucleotidyltransferase [Candidatus Gracilibacteria bacterium]|nr:sugar phosphate nucleotidyltransferase [Candidatus Gracilibacteria bacterium]
MQFLLLAGGVSSRLWPIPDKNTIEFCGKPLIRHRTENLFKFGFKKGVIVINKENKEDCQEALSGIPNVEFVEQAEALGMADALLKARSLLDEELTLLVTSVNDLVTSEAFKNLLNQAKSDPRAEILLTAKKVSTYFPGGYLDFDPEGYVHRVVEKPDPEEVPSEFVNIVLHYFKDWPKFFDILETIKGDNKDDTYEKAFELAAGREIKIRAVEYKGFWQALKYPWHILPMMNYLIENQKPRIHRSAEISKKATIKGHVIIEEGVKIFENAVIRGPAYIGKGAVIANNALVRDSHIGEGSVVGYNTEVARSYLGKNVWTHSNYIGDSVISNNCSFGAGTVTGNLRLDEGEISSMIKGERKQTGLNKLGVMMGPDCRVGINTNLMPGVKIGKDCFIAAGLNVAEDLLENTYLSLEQQHVKKENMASAGGDRDGFKGKL